VYASLRFDKLLTNEHDDDDDVLPSQLKLITSINSFKCKLKTHINNLV